MDINRNNYENFFLLYLDKELNPAERVDVENFLRTHADLQQEFSLLQHTIPRPVETVFEPKELLYRREEKRRVIPVYRTRIAAALILFLAGSWLIISVLKNQKTLITDKEQTIAAADAKKNHQLPGAAEKLNQSGQEQSPGKEPAQELKKQKDIPETPVQTSQGSTRIVKANPVKSAVPGHKPKSTATGDPIQYSSEQKSGDGKDPRRQRQPVNPDSQLQEINGEAVMVMQKSNTTPELQTSMNRNTEVAPGLFAGGGKTPSLMIAVVGKNHPAENENQQLTDIQTDNAISVIALNDRNKAITGFFKKLTKRASGDETADNTKKLRVSVFQFSY